MRYAESAKLAERHPAIRGVIERCDALLHSLEPTAEITAERWARILKEDRHRVASVLEGLANSGLLVATAARECECGVINANSAELCTCGTPAREGRECVVFTFSEQERARKREAAVATVKENPTINMTSEEPKARIGIITALPKEFAAMEVMLENPREWHVVDRGVVRKYLLGDIPSRVSGTHQVVVTLLPDVGNNQASARATLMLQHVKSIRNVIMCGIAGGIPRHGEPEHDVRLGDIVFSSSGGVIEYDFGKDDAGKWEPRHRPRPPSAELLEACRHLEAGMELGRRPWETYLPRASLIKGAERPPDNEDAKGRPIAYPPDPERVGGLPRVFQSPIASSNTLQKNPAKRDELAKMYGVKAVEMEGSGIADATWGLGDGYLVVRGIVDYCDQEKGDHWHRYGAVVAAAYVRALIESMAALD